MMEDAKQPANLNEIATKLKEIQDNDFSKDLQHVKSQLQNTNMVEQLAQLKQELAQQQIQLASKDSDL